MADELTIRRAGVEVIPELKPLYAVLNDHQTTVAPILAGMSARPDEDSWRRRRAMYERWLSGPGAFALLADRDQRLVAYAVVSIGDGFQGWASGERVGDLHDLAVLPAERGRSVGTILMDAVERELTAAGIAEIRLRVIAANGDALRFYERRGMTTISHIMVGRLRPNDS